MSTYWDRHENKWLLGLLIVNVVLGIIGMAGGVPHVLVDPWFLK